MVMRILVVCGDNSLTNVGDAAMLMAAIKRLNFLWPHATIDIVTSSPDRLAAYCPGTVPVLIRYPWWWRWLKRWLGNAGRSGVSRYRPEIEAVVRRRWPTQFKRDLLRAVSRADIVVHSGAGIFNDEFLPGALWRLDILQRTIQAGKPTAMFGQGIGPLTHPTLTALAKAVFPAVDLITLREKQQSLPILLSLGVSPSRIMAVGDDVIALSYPARSENLGDGIGVNVRLASYSGLSDADSTLLTEIGEALQYKAGEQKAELIPLPISEEDTDSIHKLLSLSSLGTAEKGGYVTPLEVMAQVGRCRIVVTGSYHAAVFALAQGINVVCLARSTYYAYKFQGLADQFGTGCQVLLLDDGQVQERLKLEIEKAWVLADEVRPKLLEAARRQAQLIQEAYRRFYDFVESTSDEGDKTL
jgi:polysaccharide pyruvyl transferase WcaK-like protein